MLSIKSLLILRTTLRSLAGTNHIGTFDRLNLIQDIEDDLTTQGYDFGEPSIVTDHQVGLHPRTWGEMQTARRSYEAIKAKRELEKDEEPTMKRTPTNEDRAALYAGIVAETQHALDSWDHFNYPKLAAAVKDVSAPNSGSDVDNLHNWVDMLYRMFAQRRELRDKLNRAKEKLEEYKKVI